MIKSGLVDSAGQTKVDAVFAVEDQYQWFGFSTTRDSDTSVRKLQSVDFVKYDKAKFDELAQIVADGPHKI